MSLVLCPALCYCLLGNRTRCTRSEEMDVKSAAMISSQVSEKWKEVIPSTKQNPSRTPMRRILSVVNVSLSQAAVLLQSVRKRTYKTHFMLAQVQTDNEAHLLLTYATIAEESERMSSLIQFACLIWEMVSRTVCRRCSKLDWNVARTWQQSHCICQAQNPENPKIPFPYFSRLSFLDRGMSLSRRIISLEPCQSWKP